ncbi:MAG: DUF2178 domain-containing protein [Clostridia bacterium]|nr:DUF2178 domain-containing protein [Clostridia bacterium]
MKVNKRQWIQACIPLAIGIVFLVWGIVISESMLTGAGTGMLAVSITALVSLWKRAKGDEKELDKIRGAKDERMAIVQGKAAMVAMGIFIIASLATAVALMLLDMIVEATIVMGLFFVVDIAFLVALKYYNKKI